VVFILPYPAVSPVTARLPPVRETIEGTGLIGASRLAAAAMGVATWGHGSEVRNHVHICNQKQYHFNDNVRIKIK
jgi:hypothetical protein